MGVGNLHWFREGVTHNQLLSVLDFSHNQIEDRCLEQLAEMIEELPHLKSINLSHNRITGVLREQRETETFNYLELFVKKGRRNG